MKKILQYIGIVIFIGWTAALLFNYSIYQHTTSQLTFIHPIVDGILFMAIMAVIYFVVMGLYSKKQASASIVLGVLGTFSLLLAVFFAL